MANKEETCVFLDHLGATKTSKVQVKPFNNNNNRDGEGVVMSTMKIIKKRRSVYPLLRILTGLIVVLWLVGLTVVRELQLISLRSEIAGLRSDLDNLSSLVYADGLMDELIKFENQIHDEEKAKSSWKNMKGDSEFENEDILDEYEDSMEDDDSDFLGHVMEVHTNPISQIDEEDNDDYEDDFEKDGKAINEDSDENLPMKKVMRIPKSDIEDESEMLSRSRRDVVAETPDGVPIMDEPYLVARAKNKSRVLPQPENVVEFLRREHNSKELFTGWDSSHRNNRGEYKRKTLKKYEEMVSSTATPSQVFTRPSRVMTTSEERYPPLRKFHVVRRPMLRSGPEGEHASASTSTENRPKRRRKHRVGGRARSGVLSRNVEMLEESSYPAIPPKAPMVAHFEGDTSGFKVGTHEHFAGNGRLRHLHDVPYTAWTPASWLLSSEIEENFPLQDGAVTIRDPGLYFVYAQVYFHDVHDTNAFRVYRNNGVQDEAILQCTTMTHSADTMEKANTCYTAGAFKLNEGDVISVKNLGSMRYSIMEKGKSFFGFIKLGDGGLKVF